MAVLKNKTQGNYTLVSQNIVRDRNLSLTERGMLLTLLSLPDNWHFTIIGLCQIIPDGKDKVARTLNSLIEKGYVTREQGRGSSGKFDSTNIEVHQMPIKGESSPHTENPHTVNQDTDEPHADNPPQYNINILNTNRVNNYEVCKEGTLTDEEYEKLILEFGKASVDNQLRRISNNNYKGCCNYETIRTWCKERLERQNTASIVTQKKNSFFNFQQRTYDMKALERELVGY